MSVKLQKHLNHIYPVIMIVIIATIGAWFAGIFENNHTILEIIYLYIPVIILFVLPTVVLHLNYYLKNKNFSIVESDDELKVIINNRDEYRLTEKTIDSIEYSVSPAMHQNRFLWSPFDYYRHVTLYLKDGNKLVLTSLLLDDFSYFLKGPFNVKINTSLFRFAK